MSNMRFPRSLSEAFPQERAVAVEIYRSPARGLSLLVVAACVSGLCLLVGILIGAYK
jgi:zinc transporter ZupT